MKKVVHVFTVSMSAIFLEGLSEQLKKTGYELVVISADGIECRKGEQSGEFSFYPVNMARGISPLQNLKCWFKVRNILKNIKPEIVHGNTPVGSFIAMSAAWSLGIKKRVCTLHGLKYPSETGIKRVLVKTIEKISLLLPKKAFAVSTSLRDYAIAENLVGKNKLIVLNHGSVKGIDVEKSKAILAAGRNYYERSLGLRENSTRIGYFGRINEDKGIPEYVEAVKRLYSNGYILQLLFCGIKEFKNLANERLFDEVCKDTNAVCTGFVSNPLEYMKTCDIIVLPTHREGFGLVNIEANSVGVPVVTTDVMGCKDSIEDGETGLFSKVNDVDDIYEKIRYLLDNDDERARMSINGIERSKNLFNRQDIWRELIREYNSL